VTTATASRECCDSVKARQRIVNKLGTGHRYRASLRSYHGARSRSFYVYAGDQNAGPEGFQYRENRRADDRSSATAHRVQSEATFGWNYTGAVEFITIYLLLESHHDVSCVIQI